MFISFKNKTGQFSLSAIILTASIFASPVLAQDVIIRGATVLTMQNGQIVESADVHVKEDRIISVGANGSAEPTKETVIIDARGKFLMPGLVEMHGHLPFSTFPRNRAEQSYYFYLSAGVTSVRGVVGDLIQFGHRSEIDTGILPGPKLYLGAPSLNGKTVSSPDEGRELVRQYAHQGWDFQPIHFGLTLEEYDAIIDEAGKVDYPVSGHVPSEVGLEKVLAAKQSTVDHLDGYLKWLGAEDKALSDEDIERAVSATKAAGVTVMPTQALFDLLLSQEDIAGLVAQSETDYTTAEIINGWAVTVNNIDPSKIDMVRENRQRLIKAFADNGISIVLGSDAPQTFSVPGYSLWREIQSLRSAGLSNQQILESATSAAGEALRDLDKFGQIAKSHRADLLLLNTDPRDNITALFDKAGVMAGGVWYSQEEIQIRLDEIVKEIQGN